jgi:hypothetical protein
METIYHTGHYACLDEMRSLVADYKMVIAAGAPIKIENNLLIGSFIIQLDGFVAVYTK